VKICKLFGHKWHYYKTVTTYPIQYTRCCKRCMSMEELHDRYSPIFPKNWFRQVEFTQMGAKKELGSHYQ
jgi:hypothetical protein